MEESKEKYIMTLKQRFSSTYKKKVRATTINDKLLGILIVYLVAMI
jgi:hypothetical protein